MKTTLLLLSVLLLSACGKAPTLGENYWEEAEREHRSLVTTEVDEFKTRAAFLD